MNIVKTLASAISLFISLACHGQVLSACVIGDNSNSINGAVCKIHIIPDSTEYSSVATDSLGYFKINYPEAMNWQLSIYKCEYQTMYTDREEVLKALEYKMPLVFKLTGSAQYRDYYHITPKTTNKKVGSIKPKELDEGVP